MGGGGPYDRFVIKKQERQVAPPDEWDFELWRNVKKTIILGSGEDYRNVIQDFKFRIRIFVSFQLSFFVLVRPLSHGVPAHVMGHTSAALFCGTPRYAP